MSLHLLKTICAAASLAACGTLAAAPKPPAGFDGTFALIKTRNIFDPQRQPGLATPAATAAPAVTRADYAALTGIMVTEEKVLAFFSGSRPEFNTVLKAKGVIAGATITRITPNFIEVKRGGKTIPVTVGQTVPLDANSSPGLAPAPAPAVAAATPSAAAPFATQPTNFPPPASAPAPSSADRDAVMRRMMEKRQQELR